MALSDDRIYEIAEAYGTLDSEYRRAEFARAIEAEVRKDDEALIRQMLDALEHIHRCIPVGGFAQIHWGSSTFEQIVQAAEAGRAAAEIGKAMP